MYNVEVAAIEHFNWPLEVYGVVSAQDTVDRRRNPLFLRPREDCQVIDEKVCILSIFHVFIYSGCLLMSYLCKGL